MDLTVLWNLARLPLLFIKLYRGISRKTPKSRYFSFIFIRILITSIIRLKVIDLLAIQGGLDPA